MTEGSDRRRQALQIIAEEDAALAARLREAHARVADANAELSRCRQELAAIVGEMAARGYSDSRTAEVLGRSKSRVAQLRRSL